MASVVVVGTQWGDEGKGKIVDLLTRYADFIVRFQFTCVHRKRTRSLFDRIFRVAK